MSLIHILDKQTDRIIGTLNIGEYTDDEKVASSENENTFDFTALKKFDLLQKRNRLLLQDRDGFFSEYLIVYAEQNSRNQKFIKSNATFTDLQKAKIIEPQTLQGATADTATTKALEGTEWRKGKVDFKGIRTLKIEEYTNPYSLLKSIASEFGLDLRFRVAIEGNKIIRYVDLTLPDDTFDGKEVVFGKDLIGLRRIEDAQSIVTALLVLGPEQEDGKRLTVLVEDNDALQRWGRNGQHLIDVYEPQISAEEVTVERLRALGENKLQKLIDAIVSYECQAAILDHIPGKEHEKVRLDKTQRVKDEGYTPPLYVEAKVIEVKEKPSTGEVLEFKLGNYKEYSKADLEAQIAGLKKQLNDKLSKLVQVSVTSSAGTVFKNGTGETDLTAVTILGGKEVDTDGLFYTYTWAKYDKNGNFVGATSGKSITVYARNIDEKETYIVTVENEGAKSIGQITISNVNDGSEGAPGKSVETITEYYLATSANSGVTRSTTGWTTTFQPVTNEKKYLWSYKKITYKNPTDEEYTDPFIVGVHGDKGEPGPAGRSVTSIVEEYYYSSSPTTQTGGSWSTTYPAYQEGKYLWTRAKTTFSDGTTTYTTPVCVTGTKGADGVTTYTWTRYADDEYGNGISDSPTGKRYWGVATNKTTPIESNNPSDYKWAPLYDNVKVGGRNLIRKSEYFFIYNNFNVPYMLTVDKSIKYLGQDVYKLSMTPNATYLYSFKTEHFNHGVRVDTRTFYENTPYIVSVYWKPISHMDISVGLTASNIGGWKDLYTEPVGDGWYRSVATYIQNSDRTDSMFFSFKCPSATAGNPIEMYWACPQLEVANVVSQYQPAYEDTQAAIDQAKQDAQNAQSTADGKNTVFHQDSEPSKIGRKIGDLWFKTNEGNKIHRFDGSNWVAAQFGNAAIANLDVGKITGNQGNFNWLEAKHIKSLNGLNVGNGQFVVDANGNVKFAGNLEGASGTFGQVAVKDGDFYLEDTNSNTKYSIVQKGNMIKDHSFELVWTQEEQEDSATYFWMKMHDTWASNSSWRAVGTPMVGLSGLHGPAPINARPVFGDRAIIVNASNYVFQTLWNTSGNTTYTLSAFAKRAYNLAQGALRMEVYRVTTDIYGNTTETLLKAQNFSTVAGDYKAARYSMTFTTPAMSQSDELKVVIKGTNTNWVHVDGVQLVENSSPVVYADESTTWDIINGRFGIQTWTDFAGMNGWRNYGAEYTTARYRQLSTREVVVTGMLKDGVVGLGMVRLPQSMWPIRRMVFSCMSSVGAVRVDVMPDGYIVCMQNYGGWVSIDGIRFFPDA